MTTTQESQDRALLAELGLSEDDMIECMGPVVEQARRMAADQERDPEEFFLSLDDELFGPLALGYLAAKRAEYTGTTLQRMAAQITAHVLNRAGRPDLVPLAAALGRLFT
jgi:hypothetical protein